MSPLALGQIAEATGGRIVGVDPHAFVKRVVTDSREVRSGDLFVALRGARCDGHAFAAQARARGAAACLVDERGLSSVAATRDGSDGLIVVDDTVRALGRLAAWYRRAVLSPLTTVVAITGSNGKTTTKQMLQHVLSGAFTGQASPKSFNNEIGVPLTLLAADRGDRYLIVEVGTNAPGEIAALSALIEPDVAVITSIGEAHLEGLGDVGAVAAEKASLLGFVRAGGLAVVNTERPQISPHLSVRDGVALKTMGRGCDVDVPVQVVASSLSGTLVEVGAGAVFEVPLPGAHHAANVAAAVTVARWMGMADAPIRQRSRTFAAGAGRAAVIRSGATTLIDDAYNANPTSMEAAVDALARATAGRRVMILGDMFELGGYRDRLHTRVVERARASGIDVIVAVGAAFTQAVADRSAGGTVAFYCFHDAALAATAVPALVREGDCIWVKGSRVMGLEQIVDRLRRLFAPQAAVA